MTARRFATSTATLGLGSALAGGLYWALLNVPESNIIALALSAALVVLIVVAVGVTIAAALALAQEPSAGHVVRRAFGALPVFVGGLLIFAALWWATGAVDAWWSAHAGEIDALFVRYGNWTRTRWLHTSISWLMFLVRWAFGASIVLSLVAASVSGGAVLRRGVRLSVRVAPLAAATLAVVVMSEGLWRALFWRPQTLATSIEPAFVAAKLVLLYAAASVMAAAVVAVYRWSVSRAAI